MLDIINNLWPFFEDCYRRISVREYAKIVKVSPPTGSAMLLKMRKNGLLVMEKDRNYLFFHANKENKDFIDLSRIYWRDKLNELILHLDRNLVLSSVVLFGSLAKAESLSDSDIDIAIFANKKELNLINFEKKLKRKIQLFFFDSVNKIENKELANNILNGYVLFGRLKL